MAKAGRRPIADWQTIISEAITKENPAEPLTDQEIADRYSVHNTLIFRYRKTLGIESAHERRRKYRQSLKDKNGD